MKFTHTCNFHNVLDLDKIKSISNYKWNKPTGGFWLSVNEGWERWCEKEEPDWLRGLRYEFTLKSDASIYWITSDEDAWVLPDNPLMDEYRGEWVFKGMKFIDFENISKRYDAIGVMIQSGEISRRTLDGWDCDSMLVMNPSIIDEFKQIDTYIPKK